MQILAIDLQNVKDVDARLFQVQHYLKSIITTAKELAHRHSNSQKTKKESLSLTIVIKLTFYGH